ncbi:MAG: hypothetical protein ISS80_05000 [Candidatus Cloacimonetes bacterium]|nr:hypothetical protein [Candidatus Cloacimonadota bacterium]MBL7149411.1 hypothetical protein [Candidatus Cloacimonadota bacterium]
MKILFDFNRFDEIKNKKYRVVASHFGTFRDMYIEGYTDSPGKGGYYARTINKDKG